MKSTLYMHTNDTAHVQIIGWIQVKVEIGLSENIYSYHARFNTHFAFRYEATPIIVKYSALHIAFPFGTSLLLLFFVCLFVWFSRYFNKKKLP